MNQNQIQSQREEYRIVVNCMKETIHTYLNDELHSIRDLPAVLEGNFWRNGLNIWYQHGLKDRDEDNPAEIRRSVGRKSSSISNEYYQRGRLHRIGPNNLLHPDYPAKTNLYSHTCWGNDNQLTYCLNGVMIDERRMALNEEDDEYWEEPHYPTEIPILYEEVIMKFQELSQELGCQLVVEDEENLNERLMKSAKWGDRYLNTVKFLLERGADAKFSQDGKSVLAQVVESNCIGGGNSSIPVIRLLLEYGASPEVGESVIELAEEKYGGDDERVRLLKSYQGRRIKKAK